LSDIAIRIEHLSKKYRLGVINNGTLFRDIQTWMALKRGKEDPHSRIDDTKYTNTEDFFWALKNISLDITQGKRVGIIGKNGAGKSTLLKLLSRITAPTEGTIKIKGKIASLLEVGTGFHGELTGRENAYLNGAILGMKKRRIDQKIDQIIAFSGIEHHIDTPVKRYSSGMYVRLAFAIAAHLDSDILIADEVLAVGDTEFQKKALGKMQDLSTGEGRTVLFVSHNMSAVKSLCNCGVVLEKGEIKAVSDDINKLAADYFNNFNKNISIPKWVNNNEIHDRYFTPLSIELLEENGQTIKSEISAEKNYQIKLLYEIKEMNSFLYYFFVFSDTDGTVLFKTNPWNSDIKSHLGTNTVYCSIPSNFLNINDYIISLGVFIHNDKWIIEPQNYVVSINMKVLKINNYPVETNTLIAPAIRWYSNDQ
jgi:lipopolysaccharide transport system ATP-binding protein